MSYDLELARQNIAKSALQFIEDNQIIGVGTGKTVNAFIAQLATIKHKIAGDVASSEATKKFLLAANIPVADNMHLVSL